MNIRLRIALPLALLLGSGMAGAESLEERLRAQLRSTTQQLQALQSEQAQAVAARNVAESQLAAAQAQIRQLGGELAQARGQAEQLATHQAQLRSAAQAQVSASQEQVGKFRQAYEELLARARAVEAERGQLASGLTERDARLQQCGAQNQRMYEVAGELLAAYEKIDVAAVMKIRQPFAGGARVKFEELAQIYADRLYQSRFDAAGVRHP